ncbi:MAG TPA: hypothetical protein VJ953_07190 [Saprospiraceae bacterium]|nr:hypothetical protein [Saprospiraceae bacterium]
MKKYIFLVALFSLGMVFSASAQSQKTPKASKRQVVQTKRIKQGVKTGELTRGEVAVLGKQQRSINRSKRSAKADGQVTRAERVQIQNRQNRANRNIKRKKNNKRAQN